MRENGIKTRTKKKFKVTTKSDHNLPIAQDLVERDFSISQMNELWLSDITYIWTWEGWMYLAAVMAMMESFFSSLKKELFYLMTFHSKDQARRAIFEYIEIFYNRQRRHSALNYKSPLEYYKDATQTF